MAIYRTSVDDKMSSTEVECLPRIQRILECMRQSNHTQRVLSRAWHRLQISRQNGWWAAAEWSWVQPDMHEEERPPELAISRFSETPLTTCLVTSSGLMLVSTMTISCVGLAVAYHYSMPFPYAHVCTLSASVCRPQTNHPPEAETRIPW